MLLYVTVVKYVVLNNLFPITDLSIPLLITNVVKRDVCFRVRRLTTAWRHGRDLERVRVGGAHSLLFVLSGHLDRLTDEWQLLAGDHVVFYWTMNGWEQADRV